MASGWNSGRGDKLTRRGEYERALRHYKLALEYTDKCGNEPNPTTVECLARTQARLGDLKQALLSAEKSLHLYKSLRSENKLIVDSTTRVERFIAALKSGNIDEINALLTI
jgi:tetratricopeptide (TPR) repeat protein